MLRAVKLLTLQSGFKASCQTDEVIIFSNGFCTNTLAIILLKQEHATNMIRDTKMLVTKNKLSKCPLGTSQTFGASQIIEEITLLLSPHIFSHSFQDIASKPTWTPVSCIWLVFLYTPFRNVHLFSNFSVISPQKQYMEFWNQSLIWHLRTTKHIHEISQDPYFFIHPFSSHWQQCIFGPIGIHRP